jgi:hypothetical protein
MLWITTVWHEIREKPVCVLWTGISCQMKWAKYALYIYTFWDHDFVLCCSQSSVVQLVSESHGVFLHLQQRAAQVHDEQLRLLVLKCSRHYRACLRTQLLAVRQRCNTLKGQWEKETHTYIHTYIHTLNTKDTQCGGYMFLSLSLFFRVVDVDDDDVQMWTERHNGTKSCSNGGVSVVLWTCCGTSVNCVSFSSPRQPLAPSYSLDLISSIGWIITFLLRFQTSTRSKLQLNPNFTRTIGHSSFNFYSMEKQTNVAIFWDNTHTMQQQQQQLAATLAISSPLSRWVEEEVWRRVVCALSPRCSSLEKCALIILCVFLYTIDH